MKILFIHNSYSDKTPTGEEHASQELATLLEEHGHEVKWYRRSSDEIRKGFGPLKSFFTGIYNPSSAKALAKLLDEYNPDVVQVQNLYPLLSSSVFKPIKQRSIPAVMRCPNYRLFCPSGLCLNRRGEVCERCWGKGHEWWCVLGNCEHDFIKSVGYAIRNAYNRIFQRIFCGVDVFIVQSEFQKQKFVTQGIPKEKVCVLSGISPDIRNSDKGQIGDWVSLVGRVIAEKGIYEFIEAARRNPSILFKVAGFFDANFVMPNDLPNNLEFVGFKKGDELNRFYLNSRIIVVPSKWYEGFPNVILRAFMLNKPVITTKIGAMQSIVESDVNGILVAPGDANSLSDAIERLYPQSDLCRLFGIAGHKKADTVYSRDMIYQQLINIYGQASRNRRNRYEYAQD